MKLSPFLVIATLAFLAAAGCAGDNVPVRATVTVAEAMAADTVGYARATAVRPFVFPEDHGPHPDFKSEWWYLTGNLAAADGRRFGYELTIFRFALAPPDGTVRASAWATRQLYMGHFAVTDVAGRRFFPFER
ncbi:MAG: carotenoid 1,2-hydratase, partial [Bacteroidetes bacterium]